MSNNFKEELEWRGLIQDLTNGFDDEINKECVSAYIGFDPTSDSLHIGSLVQLIILRHFQICGHKPIVLVGGATGMIGDPSGKSKERNLLSSEIIEKNIPVFGICLGHQILARACDVSTYKLHNGHRGINHPVKNLSSGKSEVTSQNHGFGVSMEEIKKSTSLELTHVNLNDDTVEGIKVKGKKAFSVQYHPESSPGPHDSRYLFDDFINIIKGE